MTNTASVRQHMTPQPHTIGKDQPLSRAEKMMREFRIHHLPVLDAGRLVGILSDRDIKLVETLKDVNPDTVLVEEAFTPDPYVVSPDASLKEVCATMAERYFGCALVEENHKLIGIFTWVDALRVLGGK